MNERLQLVARGASYFSFLPTALHATQTINDAAARRLTFVGPFALDTHLCHSEDHSKLENPT